MSAVTRVYTSVRGLSTAIKDMTRLREIVGVLAKHGFGALVTRMGLTETVGVKNIMEYADEDQVPYSTPQRLRMAIEELGPTFIKLGQILSTRADLLPAETVAELQQLQDDVPEMSVEVVREQATAALGKPLEEVFAAFDEQPLACASIAQVHLAVMADTGQEVVVKVQRPNIAARIESDLNIMHYLARRAEALVPELQLMDPVGIVDEFERAILKEINFRNEVANIRRFRENFRGFEGVRIPRVFDALCTPTLVVMERITGVKVTLAPEELDVDPYTVAPRMLRALFKMLFRDGYFHGDLHPGNILIDQDGTIGLIDFGLVGRLSESQRDDIMDILIGMSREDYAMVSRVFFDVGVKVPGVTYDYAAFERDVVEVMQKHLEGKTLHEIDVGGYFADLVGGAIRHRIKMPPTYTMVFKALMTVEGIGKTLAPDLNLLDEVQPFVKELLVERYSPRRLLKEGVDTLGSLSRFLKQFPHTATQLLRDAEHGRLTLKVDLQRIEELVEADQIGRKRLAHAVVAGAACIAGSLALDAGGPTLVGMSAPAFLLYVLAAIVGAPIVLGVLRRG